jgi:hypothetical protein
MNSIFTGLIVDRIYDFLTTSYKKDLYKELKLYHLRGIGGCSCNLSEDLKKAYIKYKNIVTDLSYKYCERCGDRLYFEVLDDEIGTIVFYCGCPDDEQSI